MKNINNMKKIKINNPIDTKHRLKLSKEISKEALIAYEVFLDGLTDANYHTLRNDIVSMFTEAIDQRNKRVITK